MFNVTELYIYPVKSLGGISLSQGDLTESGFKYDRRWMLIDENNKHITQREFPTLALLTPAISNYELEIHNKNEASSALNIPLQPERPDFKQVEVWDDHCRAQIVSKEADQWFSDFLHTKCQLVYMPEDSKRLVDGRYARNDETTTFTDGYPFLMICEESLADLNSRMTEPIPMNRFRPNIVFTGGAAYEEDLFEHFSIETVEFFGVKYCERCVVTTIDQQTIKQGKEPLKTLAGYRFKNNKIYFGQYLVHHGNGAIKTGSEIVVHKMKARTGNLLLNH